jgi:Protein of unknown function (DUF2510)
VRVKHLVAQATAPRSSTASPRSLLDPSGPQLLRWWNGGQWGEQTQPMPGRWQGPPIAKESYGRQPWPRSYKVLAALGGVAALIILIVGIASASGNTRQADSASTAATATATPSRTPTHRPVAAQTTPVSATTAPAPVATAHASPPHPASTTPAGCHPLTNAGNCYEPGEYCRAADHGLSGIAGDREAITCEDNDGWRWEPSLSATVRPTSPQSGTSTPPHPPTPSHSASTSPPPTSPPVTVAPTPSEATSLRTRP